MTSRNTCNICKVHYPLSWAPETHYATRPIHPACGRCGSLFRDKEEFAWVGTTFQLVMSTVSNAFIASPQLCFGDWPTVEFRFLVVDRGQ